MPTRRILHRAGSREVVDGCLGLLPYLLALVGGGTAAVIAVHWPTWGSALEIFMASLGLAFGYEATRRTLRRGQDHRNERGANPHNREQHECATERR